MSAPLVGRLVVGTQLGRWFLRALGWTAAAATGLHVANRAYTGSGHAAAGSGSLWEHVPTTKNVARDAEAVLTAVGRTAAVVAVSVGCAGAVYLRVKKRGRR